MKFHTNSTELTKAIDGIKRAGAKLDKDIQAALVGCAFQAIEHGNITPTNTLFLALPTGTRRTAVAAWIVNYIPVTQNADKATKAESPFLYDKAKAIDIKDTEGAAGWCEQAITDSWTEFKPEADPVSAAFDLRKELTRLLTKCAKASKNGNPVEGIELVAKLSAIITEGETDETGAIQGL